MGQCVIIWLPWPIIRLARLGNNPPSCQMTPCVRVGKWRWINWGPEENEAPHYCSSWSWYKSERGPSRYWEVLFVALDRTTAPGISGGSCKLVRFPPIALDFDQWSGKLAGQCLGGWLTTWRTSSRYLWQTQGRSNKFQEGTHKAFCQISVGDTLATNFKGGAKTWDPMSTPLRTSTEADNTAEEVWAPWPNICGFVFHHIVHCDAFADLFSISTWLCTLYISRINKTIKRILSLENLTKRLQHHAHEKYKYTRKYDYKPTQTKTKGSTYWNVRQPHFMGGSTHLRAY